MAAAGFRLAALAVLTAGCTSVTASQASFDGTRWHVTAINGNPTPAAGDYSLQFAQGNVGARFGCNHIGGRYSALGDTLRTFDVHSTLMGCPEPAATAIPRSAVRCGPSTSTRRSWAAPSQRRPSSGKARWC